MEPLLFGVYVDWNPFSHGFEQFRERGPGKRSGNLSRLASMG